MDDLAHLVEFLIDPGFGAFKSLLAEIDCLTEEGATLLDLLGITAVFEFDAFPGEEPAQVLV